MKSKRRAWVVAGVVVVLAVGVSMPFRQAIWMGLAYKDEGKQYAHDPDKILLRKRYSWLPGKEFRAPPQSCPSCRKHLHEQCLGGWMEFAFDWGITCGETPYCICLDPSHGKAHYLCWDCREDSHLHCMSSRHPCTCPHPSHAQDSE